jgi:hypothetical protein
MDMEEMLSHPFHLHVHYFIHHHLRLHLFVIEFSVLMVLG